MVRRITSAPDNSTCDHDHSVNNDTKNMRIKLIRKLIVKHNCVDAYFVFEINILHKATELRFKLVNKKSCVKLI